jgi:hypothetical protein
MPRFSLNFRPENVCLDVSRRICERQGTLCALLCGAKIQFGRTFMKTKVLLSFFLSLSMLGARGQGTAFTYQGRLNDGGSPATGYYDVQFTLYATNITGTAVAGPVTNSATAVSNGLFIATIDFGPGVFNGTNYWLDVAVRTNGAGAFTELTPRQLVTPTPYAIYSADAAVAGTANGVAAGSITAGDIAPGQVVKSLNGYSDAISFAPGPNIGLTASGNNLLISAVGLWTVNGNTGTTAGLNFLGTTDNQPLELRVNGKRALQLLPDNSTNNAPDIVGGSLSNAVSMGLLGDTISGGSWNTIGPASLFSSNNPYGEENPALDASYSTIAGGFLNQIQAGDTFSTIAGGAVNTVQSGAVESTIGGGYGNTILSNAAWSIIAGGTHHTVGSVNGFIGGGWENAIQTNSGYSAIGGGLFNGIQGNAGEAVIGGGYNNTLSGYYSVIGGGSLNMLGGNYSVIAGGQQNSNSASYGTIAGGQLNSVRTQYGVIGGGYNNTISNTPNIAGTIAGGYQNTMLGSGSIGGGAFNTIGTGPSCTIAGGYGNNIANGVDAATIGGGAYNTEGIDSTVIAGGRGNSAQGQFGTVGGGANNTAGGLGATVPGGQNNLATGVASFAAGNKSQATNDGAFVWSDISATNSFNSTSSNQFLIRASGGVGINTNNPSGAALNVAGLVRAGSFQGDGSGLTNVTGSLLGNYIFAYATSVQIASSPGIFQDILFNNTPILTGWTVNGGGDIYFCSQTGLYLVQYTAEAVTFSGGGVMFSLRANLNGLEIPGSEANGTVSSSGSTTPISKSFLVPVNSGNSLSLQFAVNNTPSQLQGGGNANVQPSASLTITRIQ